MLRQLRMVIILIVTLIMIRCQQILAGVAVPMDFFPLQSQSPAKNVIGMML